jgi:hypothetical protein
LGLGPVKLKDEVATNTSVRITSGAKNFFFIGIDFYDLEKIY